MNRSLGLLVVLLAGCGVGVDGSGDAGVDGDGRGRVCSATHAKVGWSAQLTSRAHGVRGAVEVVDDCTIRFTDLDYDGGGIDVRVRVGPEDLDSGFDVGPQLLGTPYEGGTLTVQLPEGKTLEDVERVSIWCVAAGVSFGDAVLAAP